VSDKIVLVQLSDIHMGSKVENLKFSTNAILSGYNGHDHLLCPRLEQALLDVRVDMKLADDESVHILVSGDSTRIGSDLDFAIANTYLSSQWVQDYAAASPLGLKCQPALLHTIPGNHDHWGGHWVWPQPAYDANVYTRHFRDTPWPASLYSKSGNLRLDLCAVDSNHGMQLYASDNPTAGGALHDWDLYTKLGCPNALETLLRTSWQAAQQLAPGKHGLRAIVCHHSFDNQGNANPQALGQYNSPRIGSRLKKKIGRWLFGQCPDPLELPSLQKLLALAWQYQATAVFTGHTHYFDAQPHYNPNNRGEKVWELRGSTTLQGPQKPGAVSSTPGGLPGVYTGLSGASRVGVQGFFVHEIWLEQNLLRARWQTHAYGFDGVSFTPNPTPITIL
jgi:hypothetical protein